MRPPPRTVLPALSASLLIAGCLSSRDAWKPLAPADFTAPPAVSPVAPPTTIGWSQSPGPVALPQRTAWRIPKARSGRRGPGKRSPASLYSLPQPELPPLPTPGEAAPVNPLFPDPS